MLTDEDKRWIAGQFQEQTERLRARFEKGDATFRTEVAGQSERSMTTLLREFRRGDSPAELREQSRAAVLGLRDAEL
jgi:hypothetical protein